MIKTFDFDKLDIIVPIMIEQDWPDVNEVIDAIRFQKEKYGITRFALAFPSTGWRMTKIPTLSHYEKMAEMFVEIKKELLKDGIDCGWWNQLTVKSGASEKCRRMIMSDGTETPFASCPLDPAFQKMFSEATARFAEIAKPSFVFFEDDYSVSAAARGRWNGCYCNRHLEAFAKKTAKRFTREELVEIFEKQTPESYELFRKWRELMCDSLVSLSEAVRREVDKKSPEIPIGSMQPGSCDADGDSTEKVARALAGKNHTPFCRIHGTAYCNREDSKDIPTLLYHTLYSKQHIGDNFVFYHESDTFPHITFYMSANKMRAIMSAAYSFGFDGSTFQTAQMLDDMNEELAYGKMFKNECERFNEVHRIAKQCKLQGVEIAYDPFWNTAEGLPSNPYWTESVSLFGIPFMTTESDVAFWDARQAKYKSHDEIMQYFSKGLILDGSAAKVLCARGYSKYLGVEMGEDVAQGRLQYDLGAREIIKPPFDTYSKGKNMPSAHMFSRGKNGKLLEMKIINPEVEIISEEYTMHKEFVSVAMTRFQNELGGKIVIMGMTLEKNKSHSLINYRRQHLFHEMLKWCSDSYVFAKNQPNIYTIVNEAINPEESGFYGMLTLINLGDDTLDNVTLHLPPKWQKATEFKLLDKNGKWVSGNIQKQKDELIIGEEFKHCNPMYILIK